MTLDTVKNIVLVLSGKGGVGKSSTTLQLALSLTTQGHNVGILDVDLTGPSIPRLTGKEDAKITQAPGGWRPVEVYPRLEHSSSSSSSTTTTSESQEGNKPRGSLHAISLGYLLRSRSDAVIWRGPKKTAMVRQFLTDVYWPAGTDYLLIDTPPGTSDEHIALAEQLVTYPRPAMANAATPTVLAGAVIVTTPQAISTADVRKELNFCTKTTIPILGVIENMAGYVCPCCGEVSNVFSKGGGEVMAQEAGVKFLGSVPVDTGFGSLSEGEKGEGSEVDLEGRYHTQCASLAGIFEGFVAEIVNATAR